MAKRLASLALAGALVFAAAPQALAADTIGGADTAQVPVSQELEQENCIQWLLDLLGLGGKDKITVDYLNVKGQGLRRNIRLNLVDCLVGITYTELGSIGNFAEISDRAAAEAWKAQAIAIHSYLEYQNQYGSSANALTYTPVNQIPSSTRKQMEKAIKEVADLILVYDTGSGYSVCDAVFSCSGGYNTQTGVYGTCSARDAWGTDVPYLQSVESPYEEQYHNILRRVVGKDYRMLEYNDSRRPALPCPSSPHPASPHHAPHRSASPALQRIAPPCLAPPRLAWPRLTQPRPVFLTQLASPGVTPPCPALPATPRLAPPHPHSPRHASTCPASPHPTSPCPTSP